MAESPATSLVTAFEDSRRWRNIQRRSGDIIISTPPKSGTTWTQGIVASLLWPDGDAPGRRGDLSPWVDARFPPIEQLVERLADQTHRRFLKTHSPGDCIPFDDRCRYIAVYRDGRDALVSWGNHRSAMRSEVIAGMNELARHENVTPIDPAWSGDYDALFDEWQMLGSPTRHLASWWPRRHASNVLLVHYNDLSADLEAEMRRIASFLDLEIESDRWSNVVERCRLDSMRRQAEEAGGMDNVFEGGAAAFYFKGTNGRWRDLLTDDQIERYQATVAGELSADAAVWLEHGSLALGHRPEHVGEADTRVLDTGAWHPVFSRLGQQRPTNSIDAIADRRVNEAREAGLFDNLALHGKPIPDIDRQRQPGWWANQFVAKERNKVVALEIEQELRDAMPGLWRLPTESHVVERLRQLNERIDRYNAVSTLGPMDRLEPEWALATWRRFHDAS